VDPSKIQDGLSWNIPATVNDIHNFLGLTSYYRRFIEGFSKITKLLGKDKKFKLTPACEASF
jgi:hypothetical protein